jgi:hypothetical protein
VTVLRTMPEPDAAFDPEPDDGDDGPWCHTPSPFDLHQHEMRDCRNQGPGPFALWTAHNVPTGSYL